MNKESRFERRQKLGEGGMGVVYRAWDRFRGLDVALKTLPRAEPEALLRFKQEFRALTGIQHHNLVTLYELIHEQGQWMFTMEYVEGHDLRNFIATVSIVSRPEHKAKTRSGMFHEVVLADTIESEASEALAAMLSDTSPTLTQAPTMWKLDPNGVTQEGFGRRGRSPVLLDEQRLREVFFDLATGVGALHHYGHVHCDLKPSNVMVEKGSGRVVLLDFGLVRSIRGKQPASTAGTPLYMAPEQATRQNIGPAADWYALGAMLYEALTGIPPFYGLSPLVLMVRKTSAEPPPKVLALAPEAPPDLAELADRLLVVNPHERPDLSTIRELLGGGGRTSSPAVFKPWLSEPSGGDLCLGRESEMKRLNGAFKASAQRPGMVLVHGASGMGKTTLVEAFVRSISTTASPGAPRVLRGRCYAQEWVPYKARDGIIDA
ncbi:MAG: serine/threonine-protein kinase, partial [Myxococcota bacterium]